MLPFVTTPTWYIWKWTIFVLICWGIVCEQRCLLKDGWLKCWPNLYNTRCSQARKVRMKMKLLQMQCLITLRICCFVYLGCARVDIHTLLSEHLLRQKISNSRDIPIFKMRIIYWSINFFRTNIHFLKCIYYIHKYAYKYPQNSLNRFLNDSEHFHFFFLCNSSK